MITTNQLIAVGLVSDVPEPFLWSAKPTAVGVRAEINLEFMFHILVLNPSGLEKPMAILFRKRNRRQQEIVSLSRIQFLRSEMGL